jgi:GNAT superfamily N-acetyltransferase
MTTLDDIVPLSQLRERFGDDVTVKTFCKTDLSKILKDKPLGMHALGGNIWNRIVTRQWKNVDPMQLRGHFQRHDPKLHAAISRVTGEDAIRDILMVKAWRGVPRKANLLMELLVADVYRDELHLGDVTFCDPDRPIPPADRAYEHQTHSGLGLFGVLIGNMETYAHERGYKHLTLTAAHVDLIPLFRKHGFEVEDNDVARSGIKAGISIPMERAVTGAGQRQE